MQGHSHTRGWVINLQSSKNSLLYSRADQKHAASKWSTPIINSACVFTELSNADIGQKSPQIDRGSQPQVYVCVCGLCIFRFMWWSVIKMRTFVSFCMCYTVTVGSHRSCRVHEQRPHHHCNHAVCQRSSMGVYVLTLPGDWPVWVCVCFPGMRW